MAQTSFAIAGAPKPDKLRALGYSPRTDFSDVARAVLRELDA